MKKLKFLSMALVLSMLVTGCGSSSDTGSTSNGDVEYDNHYSVDGTPSAKLTELRNSGTLVVGSSGDAPFAYIDQETGSFDGVDAEIIKEAADRLGIENVEMSLIPFSELILNLNSGNIDVIADCMYVRADRAEKVYFGDIWYTQGGGLLVAEGSGISSIEDFDPSDTIVGYTPGTVFTDVVEQWEADGLIKEARATGDQSESITALQYEKIDAFLTDGTVLENLFANTPDVVEGLELAENYESDPSLMGRIAPSVSFDNIDFMAELNAAVAEIRDEGLIDTYFEKYGLNPALHTITNDERFHDLNTR